MQLRSIRAPLYLQIQDFVREGIRTQRFSPGERLPSEPELCKRFRTTRATVARAFHQLAFEGLVERRIGSGTYVSQPVAGDQVDTTTFESHEEHVLARGEALEYRLLRFAKEAASRDVAEHLVLEAGASVHRIERLRVVGARVLALEVRFVPADIAQGIQRAWLGSFTVQHVLQQLLGLRIDAIENSVRAAASTPRIAKALELPPSSPVLVRAHTIRGSAGRPLLFGETFYPPQFTIQYTLQAP